MDYRRRFRSNKLVKLFKLRIKNLELEWVIIPGNYKSHQHIICDNDNNLVNKIVAGRATKIHLAIDAHGNPIKIILPHSITHDI